jgi:2'-5' RNA ligase
MRTALIVAVPEAEPAVGAHRAALDRAASWGVPAHVTVVFPFLAPDVVDDDVLAALRATIGAVPRFTTALRSLGWFEERVVYLAPDPDDGFRRLIHAVWQRFPDAPPYGGAHPDVVPHLTIGHDHDPGVLRRAGDAVTPHLPIAVAVHTVRLLHGTDEPGSWTTVAEFALGTAERAAVSTTAS